VFSCPVELFLSYIHAGCRVGYGKETTQKAILRSNVAGKLKRPADVCTYRTTYNFRGPYVEARPPAFECSSNQPEGRFSQEAMYGVLEVHNRLCANTNKFTVSYSSHIVPR
jgi:hypothetical protein